MRDNLNARDGGERKPSQKNARQAPFSDREVPIDGPKMSAVMQSWLDGEVDENTALDDGASARELRLWQRIESEASTLRNIRAPEGFMAKVMGSLDRDVG